MYIICLYPFVLLLAPVIGALIGRTFDEKEVSGSPTQSFEKFSKTIGTLIAFMVLILTLFAWHPRYYSPRRWELIGILIGVVLDIPLFLWVLVNASAM